MVNNRLEFYLDRSIVEDRLRLYILHRGFAGGSTKAVADPLVFRELTPGGLADPCARLAQDEAQQLMDELWRCGLRPTEGSGSAGAMAATERHLKDMQAIATRALDRILKG